MSRLFPSLLALLVPLAAACAQGSGGGDGGGGDAIVVDSSSDGGVDSGPRDSGVDAPDTMLPGDMCGGVMCTAFQECISGACTDYPSCVADSECAEGRICLHRFCIPATRDVDGDGFVAAEDCDETNPDINPGADEICNLIDDNCSGTADDGDPGLMCAMDPAGGICIDGVCGCPDGVFDIDGDPLNGCECAATPDIGMGDACMAPIDLGDFSDAGDMMTVMGNLLPEGREVWYRFRGIDTPDTSCDNLHVRVQINANPGAAYFINVFRGACDGTECDETMGYQEYTWATDTRQAIMGRLTGQCPCTNASFASRPDNVSGCEDDTADYFVRVKRDPAAPLACEPYVIEISNGYYDTM